jgi:hypothetical protein
MARVPPNAANGDHRIEAPGVGDAEGRAKLRRAAEAVTPLE